MYSFAEIQKDIENNLTFMGEDVVEGVTEECRQILQVNLEKAIPRIKIIRSQYKNTQPLPLWFRKLVFEVIYNYLCSGVVSEQYKNQTEILKGMGLSADIFSKHWKMYSPDMKYSQGNFSALDLTLYHAEVEGNPIYRAMLHHIISHSTVCTDCFVELYGKTGLVAAVCANGYKKRVVCIDNKTFLLNYLKGLLKKKSVYKQIKELQEMIDRADTWYEKTVVNEEEYNRFVVNNFINLLHDNIDKQDLDMFVAQYFFQMCIQPEYWKDANLKKTRNGVSANDLEVTKLPRKKVKQFLDLDEITFLEYCNAMKKITVIECSIMDRIKNLKGSKELLFIDIPKYKREYNRYNFTEEELEVLLGLLREYQGDWIMSWKTYIYTIKERNEDVISETEDENKDFFYSYRDIFGELNEISLGIRPLFVYKYSSNDKNEINSMVFITTIDFADIDEELFQKKYKVEFKSKASLTKFVFSEFCRIDLKWKSGRNYEKIRIEKESKANKETAR